MTIPDMEETQEDFDETQVEEDLESDLEDQEEDDSGEDDFSELDNLLAEATQATADDKALKAARKRLGKVAKSHHPEAESERNRLVADIRRLEEGRVWSTVATVALFHSQTCSSCGSKHTHFEGWFTEQKHVTDPFSRRFVAGKPVEALPARREDHDQAPVEACTNCIECVIAIEVACGNMEVA